VHKGLEKSRPFLFMLSDNVRFDMIKSSCFGGSCGGIHPVPLKLIPPKRR
jgi:hypothetical protein